MLTIKEELDSITRLINNLRGIENMTSNGHLLSALKTKITNITEKKSRFNQEEETEFDLILEKFQVTKSNFNKK
ncbi:MAG: hypothetical protein HRU03_08350 [Nanoarchaeales archaeon]|nr:hypothetical protein [Nanoarchaeales archaeon]